MALVDKQKYLKELQDKELEILDYFANFCNNNDLDYYLTYGTLLGAIRHKGFIPWDDDVDVFMKGIDYLKIKDIFNDLSSNKSYFFQSIDNEENYYLLWNKIRLNNTLFIEKGWEKNKINMGIFIDIFPLLEYPDNKLDYIKTKIQLKLLHLLIEANLVNDNRYKSYGIAGKILFKFIKLIPKNKRNKYSSKIIYKLCTYKSSSNYYYSFDPGLVSKFKKEDFSNKKLVDFNNKKFYVPKGYDAVLKETYGDYMTLPKEEDRVGHGSVYLNFKGDNLE